VARHRLVQMRTRIMNQLQALAMNEGYRWKKKLFSETFLTKRVSRQVGLCSAWRVVPRFRSAQNVSSLSALTPLTC
jgi:hypothetical protein